MKSPHGEALSKSAPMRMRRWRLVAGLVVVALLVCLATNSCVSVITPPDGPADPCLAYLLHDAQHVAVVLPGAAGGFVEYGFGDWDWFAALHDSWYHVFDTVLWSTQGCLCRRTLSGARVARLEQRGMVRKIVVDRIDAADLLGDLDQRFDAHRSTLIHNQVYGLDFVETERGYWFLYNCNDAVAEWMERLGCDVSWVPIRLGVEMAD